MKGITLEFRQWIAMAFRSAGIFFLPVLMMACEGSESPASEDTGNITTIAGTAGAFDYKGDGGQALAANLGFITGINVDATGNIYFVDGAANVIRRIDRSTGVITTIAGTFLGFNVIDPTPFKGDGGPAIEAHLNVPYGVAVDAAGNVYIADSGNSIIRKVSTDGVITTIAGKAGTFEFAGDGGLATDAKFNNPYDVAIDQAGNIYIVDSQSHAIRKIAASTAKITTVAGEGPGHAGFDGDGGLATAAHLRSPQAVAVDALGNMFIVDAGNHAVRRIDTATGIITTIAGTGNYGYNGDGGPGNLATLYAPTDVAVDAAGDVYIADQGSHVIRKVTMSTGIIHTLAGTGVAGYSGDGGMATDAKLSSPQGVAVDASGNVFITESGNSVIRAVKQE